MLVKNHLPVLLNQVITGLNLKKGQKFIDCTVGYGGHTKAILKQIGSEGKLLGIDQDLNAIQSTQKELLSFQKQLTLVCANFADLENIASREGFSTCSGILFDLGVSSPQITDPRRGFSFLKEGELDMRMVSSSRFACEAGSKREVSSGQNLPQKIFRSLENLEHYLEQNPGSVSAQAIVNYLPEKELAKLIKDYGEERRHRQIAERIEGARRSKPIKTTTELAKIVQSVFFKKERLHPATRTFQALRIVVNQELTNLRKGLQAAAKLLTPQGRLVVISFHSLEDRIVKEFFKQESRDCVCPPEFPVCRCDHKATLKIVTKKPITPSNQEVETNPRSRSAKLRIAEKLVNE